MDKDDIRKEKFAKSESVSEKMFLNKTCTKKHRNLNVLRITNTDMQEKSLQIISGERTEKEWIRILCAVHQ